MRRSTRAAAFCAVVSVVALLLAAPAHGQEAIPANDGWVTDLAGFLTPEQERGLEARMQAYKTGSGIEIALLTVPDLGGRSLEQYTLEVARVWGLGEKDRHLAGSKVGAARASPPAPTAAEATSPRATRSAG